MTNYGGFWQELRAYVAVTLIGWAQSIHFEETMNTARAFVQLEDEASLGKLEHFLDGALAESDATCIRAARLMERAFADSWQRRTEDDPFRVSDEYAAGVCREIQESIMARREP